MAPSAVVLRNKNIDYPAMVNDCAKSLLTNRTEAARSSLAVYSLARGVCPLHLMVKVGHLFEKGVTRIRARMANEKRQKQLQMAVEALTAQQGNMHCSTCLKTFTDQKEYKGHVDDVCIDVPLDCV